MISGIDHLGDVVMLYEKPFSFLESDPVPASFLESQREERERELLRTFYTRNTVELEQMVKEECDRMDYPGSMIYDVYPDRFVTEHICRRIADQFREMSKDQKEDRAYLMEAEAKWREEKNDRSGRKEDFLEELVRVLFLEEIYRRRKRRYHCVGCGFPFRVTQF